MNIKNVYDKTGDIWNTMDGEKNIKPIDIFTFAETEENLVAPKSDRYVWYGINKDPPNHRYAGAGAYIRQEIAKFTTIIKEISNQDIMWLQIVTEKTPLFLAVVYCSPSKNEVLESVNNNIRTNYNRLSKIGKVLINGDFNGRMGTTTRDALTNQRGKMITKMCKETGLEVTKSKQPEGKQWTFYHVHKGQSVIDLAIINKKDKHTISHYEVHKNVSLGSDHRLVTFNWNIWGTNKIEATEWTPPPHKFIIWTDETIAKFETQLEIKINQEEDPLDEIIAKMQNEINNIQESYNPNRSTSPQINPKLKKMREARDENLAKIHSDQDPKKRSEHYKKMMQTQKKILDHIKKIEEKQHKALWEKIMEKKQSKQADQYWKLIERLQQNYDRNLPGMLAQCGKTITGKRNITNTFAQTYNLVYIGKDREAKQFQEINNKNQNSKYAKEARKKIMKIFEEAMENCNKNTGGIMNEDIILDELLHVIKVAKKHTAPGKDDITIDAIANGGKKLHMALLRCFREMWKKGTVPEYLQTGKIIPIHKEGDPHNTSNYRPITLLSSVFKLYEKILEIRLRKFLEDNNLIPEIQIGARSNTGTTEGLFTILSAFQQNEGPKTAALLDLSKAYDRVWRKGLWAKLWQLKVRGTLFRAIMATYTKPMMEVHMGGATSDPFRMENGLRQGSVLSPLLFIALFSDSVKNSAKHTGLTIESENGPVNITGQCFIDDTILLATDPIDIMGQIDSFNMNAAVWGSILNLHKTKIISNKSIKSMTGWMDDLKMEQEQNSYGKYLGVVLSITNFTCNQHYKNIIDKARRCVFFLASRGVNSQSAPVEEAIELFNKIILPKFLYGAEVLCPSQAVIKSINNFMAMAISTLTDIPWNKDPNKTLWEAGIWPFEMSLKKSKMNFHYKICQTKKPSVIKKFYTQNNYLRLHNKQIREELGLQEFNAKHIHNLTTEGKLSKGMWKNKVTKAIEIFGQGEFKEMHPFMASIKPIREMDRWLKMIPQKDMANMLNSRQNNQTQMKCKCSDKIVGNNAIHAITECQQMEILVKRIVLINKFDETFENMKNQDIMIKALILLGKPPLHKDTNKEAELLAMRRITAELIGEAKKYTNTI